MALNTITTQIADVMHSTLTKSRAKLIIASMKSNALVGWLFANERVEYEDGGYNITNPLVVGSNPNVASYRYYDPLPVAQTAEFDTAEYGYSRVAGTVIISDQEVDENRGQSAIFKLLDAKMQALENSMQEKFSSYSYAVGAGTDMNGLGNVIPDDPTTGTLGAINQATVPQWRTSSYDFNGAINAANIEEVLDDLDMDLTVKGEKPNLILMGRNIYRSWRQAVRDKFTMPLGEGKAGKRMMDLGFSGGYHNGTAIMYDEDCPVNYMYHINDKYLRLHILKHVNMKVKQLVAPWTIDAAGSRVVWQGNLCRWRGFRTHAVTINE